MNNRTPEFERTVSETCDLLDQRWRGHDRQTLSCTLAAMLGGLPTTAKAVSSQFGIPLARVQKAYQTDRYDIDAAGDVTNVFGVGLGANGPINVLSSASNLNMCCALVAMIIVQVSSDQAQIQSTDPISGRKIRIYTDREGYSVIPVEAAVSMVIPRYEEFARDPYNTFCKHVRFYESNESANRALIDDVPTLALSVESLWKIATALIECLWPDREKAMAIAPRL